MLSAVFRASARARPSRPVRACWSGVSPTPRLARAGPPPPRFSRASSSPPAPLPPPPPPPAHADRLSPRDALAYLADAAVVRAARPTREIFESAVYGGVLLGMSGAVLVTVCGASPALARESPGQHKLLGGLVFPVGLVMITFTGADLLTSAFLVYLLPFTTHPRAPPTPHGVARIWAASFAGNLAGSAGVAAFAATALFAGDAARSAWAARLAEYKASLPWATALVKAVGANFLVNTAVFCAAAARSAGGKAIACWVPISIFVTLGLEHSVANMFLLPLGLLLGADLSAADVALSLVPVTIGNALGSLLFLRFNLPALKAIGRARAALP